MDEKDSVMIRMLLIGIVLFGFNAARGEPGSEAEQAPSKSDKFLKLARSEAAEYEFRTGEERTVDLKFHAKPLLRWSNPVAGEIYGGLFIWTADGRPEIAASLFKWYSPYTHMTHEFQSLSTDGIVGTKNGKTIWKCRAAGIQRKPVPEALQVAGTPPRRALQMRRIAAGFSAHEIDKEATRRELRLLRQPIYRYKSPARDVIGGGLFAFVLATDPELLLLIEARKTQDGPQWHYALARLNFVALRAEYRDKPVWRTGRLESRDIYGRKEPYTKVHIGKVRRIDKRKR